MPVLKIGCPILCCSSNIGHRIDMVCIPTIWILSIIVDSYSQIAGRGEGGDDGKIWTTRTF